MVYPSGGRARQKVAWTVRLQRKRPDAAGWRTKLVSDTFVRRATASAPAAFVSTWVTWSSGAELRWRVIVDIDWRHEGVTVGLSRHRVDSYAIGESMDVAAGGCATTTSPGTSIRCHGGLVPPPRAPLGARRRLRHRDRSRPGHPAVPHRRRLPRGRQVDAAGRRRGPRRAPGCGGLRARGPRGDRPRGAGAIGGLGAIGADPRPQSRPGPLHWVAILYHVELELGALAQEVGGSTEICAWHPLEAVAGLARVSLVDRAIDALAVPRAGS